MACAVTLALADIHANPSILGGGRRMEIRWVEDDGCSAGKSSSALGAILHDSVQADSCTGIVDDSARVGRVDAIVGPACSAGCEATAYTAASADLVQISYSCAAAALSSEEDFPTFARTTSAYTSWMSAVVAFAKWANWEKLSVLSSDQDLFRNAAAELARRLPANKMALAADMRFAVAKYDPYEILSELEGYGSRVVLFLAYGDETLRFGIAALRLGMMRSGWAWLGLTDVKGAELPKRPRLLWELNASLVEARQALSFWVYFEPYTVARPYFFERVRNATRDYFPAYYDPSMETST